MTRRSIVPYSRMVILFLYKKKSLDINHKFPNVDKYILNVLSFLKFLKFTQAKTITKNKTLQKAKQNETCTNRDIMDLFVPYLFL